MSIPNGLCQCGCGEETKLAPRNRASKGWIKGQPMKFVKGHGAVKQRPMYRVVDSETYAIPLSDGHEAIIDAKNWPKVAGRWQYVKGYAARIRNGKWEWLHKVVIDCPPEKECDHHDNDPMNNRESNLTPCTHSQNQKNMKKPTTNTSGYKGVSLDRASKKWCVGITVNGKFKHIGRFPFSQKIKAAKAYDKAARKYHGKFAHINFPHKSAI